MMIGAAAHCEDCMQMAVTKASAPDYNDFVPSSQEMHLEKIERKAKNGKYSTCVEFLEDCQKIADNAAAYNAPGHGKFGGPGRLSLVSPPLCLRKKRKPFSDKLGSPLPSPLGGSCNQSMHVILGQTAGVSSSIAQEAHLLKLNRGLFTEPAGFTQTDGQCEAFKTIL